MIVNSASNAIFHGRMPPIEKAKARVGTLTVTAFPNPDDSDWDKDYVVRVGQQDHYFCTAHAAARFLVDICGSEKVWNATPLDEQMVRDENYPWVV
jgi:hypothetical protein